METPKMQNEFGDAEKVNALNHIEMIRGNVSVMGANDTEFQSLNGIRDQLKAGDITPEEAIIKANNVLNSKQDYH